MILKTFLTVLVFSLFTMVVQASDMVVGYVKTAKGDALIVRGNEIIPARINEIISRNDILKTGTNSTLGVTMKDDTLIAMGSNSEVIISEFNFSPAEGKLNLFVRMLRGCVVFTSGIIGKISPESVNFSTPVGDIGLRGTRFAARLVE